MAGSADYADVSVPATHSAAGQVAFAIPGADSHRTTLSARSGRRCLDGARDQSGSEKQYGRSAWGDAASSQVNLLRFDFQRANHRKTSLRRTDHLQGAIELIVLWANLRRLIDTWTVIIRRAVARL